ncbi:MAG: sigma-70 family RNA polymerase sigma factor [Acidimicrobiia bacterium]|nr:sigma-70 family RNA polymerase sigma factor [Acidimicrobiia bacterium]NND13870.1 sigma-70 family RNA polymerase sigma factor [Acidimicrobiia bacterium]NNL28956.1 sigma-70 family RNA polymerase sigma factor [Acidimicrobiia bacterium]
MTDRAGTIDQKRMGELLALMPDQVARNELFDLARPLVRALAARFRGRGEPIEDLVQIASVAMLRAIDNFDIAKGDSLLSYATPIIIGDLRHHFRDSARMVRVPRPIREARRRVEQATDTLTQKLARAPRVAEIVAVTGMDEETVLEAVASIGSARPVSIDSVSEGSTADFATAPDEFSRLVDAESVSIHLTGLPARERKVLFLRFFRGYTQAEVAQEVGVSQVQVSRILTASLDRIKAAVEDPID